MSSRTWSSPGEFRGRRWARGCSTETSPWADGAFFPFTISHTGVVKHLTTADSHIPKAGCVTVYDAIQFITWNENCSFSGSRRPQPSPAAFLLDGVMTGKKKSLLLPLLLLLIIWHLVGAEETSRELMREKPNLIRYNDTAEMVLYVRCYVG